jgi:hypothetical protein
VAPDADKLAMRCHSNAHGTDAPMLMDEHPVPNMLKEATTLTCVKQTLDWLVQAQTHAGEQELKRDKS